MSTEFNYDFVSVGNGIDITDLGSRQIHASGFDLPPSFVTTDNIVWTLFTSDGSKTENGFRVTYRRVEDAGKCDGVSDR